MEYMSDLDIDETAVIVELNADNSIKRRLIDMGLIEGTKIKCLHKSPFGGIAAYDIRGAVIAIRSEDSENIHISKIL